MTRVFSKVCNLRVAVILAMVLALGTGIALADPVAFPNNGNLTVAPGTANDVTVLVCPTGYLTPGHFLTDLTTGGTLPSGITQTIQFPVNVNGWYGCGTVTLHNDGTAGSGTSGYRITAYDNSSTVAQFIYTIVRP